MNNIDILNDYQKIYLAYRILDSWDYYGIKIPNRLNKKDLENISKIFFYCSNITFDNDVNEIISYFDNLNKEEKIKFISYLFNIMNDLDIVPTLIKDDYSFKDFSSYLLLDIEKN